MSGHRVFVLHFARLILNMVTRRSAGGSGPKQRLAVTKANLKTKSSRGASGMKSMRLMKTSAPKGWKKVMALVRELRKPKDSPVDYVGSEMLGDKRQPRQVWAYQTLVSVMLSSQTKDVTTAEAMKKLKNYGLTPAHIHENTSVAALDKLISQVGFHATKAKHIKETTKILLDKHKGVIPKDAETLMELPGVGPKMAHLMVNALSGGRPQGIAVDTHMHRILNQLGWVDTNNPEQTRKALEAWLPYEEWSTINLLLVGLGQQTQTERSKLLQRCLSTTNPVEALRLMHILGLPLTHADKETKETILMWAAARGNQEATVRWLLRAAKTEGMPWARHLNTLAAPR